MIVKIIWTKDDHTTDNDVNKLEVTTKIGNFRIWENANGGLNIHQFKDDEQKPKRDPALEGFSSITINNWTGRVIENMKGKTYDLIRVNKKFKGSQEIEKALFPHFKPHGKIEWI